MFAQIIFLLSLIILSNAKDMGIIPKILKIGSVGM
jgi:hypothetical protein